MENMTARQIDRSIAELESQIEKLKAEKTPALINDKRRFLLNGTLGPDHIGIPKMSDEQLAATCRMHRMSDIMGILNKAFDSNIMMPANMAGKTISDVLHVLEYVHSDEKLNALAIPEEKLNEEW